MEEASRSHKYVEYADRELRRDFETGAVVLVLDVSTRNVG